MHLKGFEWVTAYRVEQSQREARLFISDEGQRLDEMKVQQKKAQAQQLERYHRGLKQECHIERCQARQAKILSVLCD